MTHVVLLSRCGSAEAFKAAVDAHASELGAWLAHEERVRRDQEKIDAGGTVPPEEHHQPYPRPLAHPDVEAAVSGGSGRVIVDYRVENDLPPPPTAAERLRAAKDGLLRRIVEAEKAAIARIVPPGRMRLITALHADASAVKKEERTLQHVRDIDRHDEIRDLLRAVDRVAAVAMNDVEDLPDLAAVEAFKIPTFEEK